MSYYYFLSLLITIIQTYIFRRCVSEEKVRAQMLENAKKPRKKSGFMARLEAAQKKQEALMREQAKQNAKRRRCFYRYVSFSQELLYAVAFSE